MTLKVMITPLAGVGLMALALPLQAQTVTHERIESEHLDFRLVEIVSDLEYPWSTAFLPDGRYLVSERPGRLTLIDDGEKTTLEGVPEVSAQGQGGLLDLALHPDYDNGENDWLYFSYSKPGDGGSATAVARARLGESSLKDVEDIFVQDRFSEPGRHYSGRLAWREDGTLLLGIGDRGQDPARAQDKGDHAGGVMRLNADGSVPDDNPFVDNEDALDELFTLGNRNIQGMTVAPDGTIWATEHGPRTGDEVNRIEAGVNYGWPEVSRGNDYATNEPIGKDSAPGMRDPLHVFEGRYAPSGLAYVSSDRFPEWEGDLLAGGLSSEKLTRLTIDGDDVDAAELVLDSEIGRIRDVRQGPDGYLYLLTDETEGSLYRLEPLN
ncbi:PQQ-dependent sugar dehydrogenase [Aidingimonas halophila]|uniref:Glucose/arabinose dehydrogenase, beta-propeller fold n=1 Tax=Aidingimonas halophila TaxID=574349 RepID=A0A1H2UB54_9GAMM|nr:PQQ-dependent sugar dehydrogenase [Aidingimonas halophila]GHC22341.1 pyrroloquinoline-quinone glucose dehydrogenase [Aidingimonas halophila]SDW52694.1 Glucose/arabinose dehydrogenase, beta-propeller fold [Aidingimonas halophila]